MPENVYILHNVNTCTGMFAIDGVYVSESRSTLYVGMARTCLGRHSYI